MEEEPGHGKHHPWELVSGGHTVEALTAPGLDTSEEAMEGLLHEDPVVLPEVLRVLKKNLHQSSSSYHSSLSALGQEECL